MTDLVIGFLSFPALLTFIFLRIPIGLAMFLTGVIGLVLITGNLNIPLGRLKSEAYTTFSSYSLSIIPLFLLMGHFATLGGMSTALFKAAESFLGHRKGGVAMAAVGACAGFGAICGSSLATAATMGKVALPELRRYGYSGGFSTATLAAGGTLGILIPPSVILVIYAILTEQNIAKLFLAAFIPGILAALGYIAAISIYVRLYPDSAGLRPVIPYFERFRSLINVWPVLIVFGLVVGGIYLGWFTPTEGAAIGAAGTGLIAFLSGGLTKSSLVECFLATARSTAMIFFIILGAAFYNGFLALSNVPQEISNFVVSQGFSPWMVLILILLFYLILGCVMDSLSMILLTIPIFFPVISVLDFGLVDLIAMQHQAAQDVLNSSKELLPELRVQTENLIAIGAEIPRETQKLLDIRVTQGMADRIALEQTAIWFGILVLIVVEVGLITPPVGMNLFIINALDRETRMLDTYKAVIFFVGSDIIRVIILVSFPIITLFLIS